MTTRDEFIDEMNVGGAREWGTPVGLAAAVDFWGELDADVLRCLTERQGGMTPAEIGQSLGISEPAVCSIVGMLAEAGRVRIHSVERIV